MDARPTTQETILSDFSLEIPAGQIDQFRPDESVFNKGSLIYLPHLKGRTSAEVADACKLVLTAGYVPVPHVGARHLKDEADLMDHIKAIRKAGATHILLLAGDMDVPAGPYEGAIDLARSPIVQDAGFTEISISGYPEGHPTLSADILETAMLEKLSALKDLPCKVTITTQFAFDAKAYIDWINALRAKGITNEIRLGVAGVTSMKMLLKYAAFCGVGASLSMLKKRTGAVMGMVTGFKPDALLRDLTEGFARHDVRDVKIHFFPFGGAEKTLSWLRTSDHFSRQQQDQYLGEIW